MKRFYVCNTGCIRRALDSTRLYDYFEANDYEYVSEVKDADVVVWDGDPLDPRSKVLVVFIDGLIQYEHEPGAQTF